VPLLRIIVDSRHPQAPVHRAQVDAKLVMLPRLGKDSRRIHRCLAMSPLNDRIRQSYDVFPYRSLAFAGSAPEHLRAVAYLFGLDSTPPERARVLELGCAGGGNCLPFAARWPEAEVVGVDISPTQIAIGQAAAQAMGLTNVRLLAASLTDLGPELGQFDYIIAHGVYSWVPEEVRQALLRLCAERLTAQGLAYVSYNVYPGWKAREVIRDAMLLDNHDRSDPQHQLDRARYMVEFLHRQARPGSLAHKLLDEQIDNVRHGRAHYLAHEYLEICNTPCYFRDFVAACREHGLDYLAEAEPSSMFAEHYAIAPNEPALRACAGDQLALEQLLDFVTQRSFRQSLLCHAERAQTVHYRIKRTRLPSLHLAGRFIELSERPQRWQGLDGAQVETRHSSDRLVLQALHAAWPGTLALQQLLNDIAGTDATQQAVLGFVEELILSGAVRARREPVIAADRRAAPCVSAPLRRLAAWRAPLDAPVALYSAWHGAVDDLDALEQRLLPLLDGQRSIDQLVLWLNAANTDEVTRDQLERALIRLHERAMLS
jgi:SAM-dependent methyltransferase/methyltransferase-like protein